MAVLWGCSLVQVDLLTATLASIRNAVGRCYPNLATDDREELAQEVYTFALNLRQDINAANAGAAALQLVSTRVANETVSGISAVLDSANDAILDQHSRASGALIAQLQAAKLAETDLIKQITSGIGSALNNAGNTIGNIAGSVTAGVGDLIGDGAAFVGSLVNQAKSSVQGVINTAGQAVNNVVSTVRTGVGNFVSNAGAFLEDIFTNVGAGLQTVVTGAAGIVGDIFGAVKDAVGRIVSDLASGVGALADRLIGLPGAIFQLGGDILEGLGGVGEGIIGGVADFLLGPFSEVLSAFSKDKENAMADVIDATISRVLNNPDTPDEYRALMHSFRAPSHPIWMVLLAFALPIIGASAISTILAPVLQPAVQAENAAVRPAIHSLGDAVTMMYRDIISDAQLREIGAKWGYTDADIVRAVTLSQTQPAPIDLVDWRNRKLLTESEFRDRLTKVGYTPGDADKISKAAEIIPPLSDLVRFAVREAFPGQVAYDGPRGSGAPARFVEQAAKLGLPAESARSYWAAHWELPSITAAFSMFHRGIIDEAGLRGLLKEQDIAPEWVDKLIAVAFDPLTRVDVRRMFELGVLSKAEVVRSYRDLGYDAQNAQRLADFVEADSAASTSTPATSERELTRADLVGAYADGILDHKAATSALREIGYDADEAALILDREDLRQIRAERKETRSAIVDQAVAGVVTFEQAEDKLLASGYSTDETKAALAEIKRKIDGQAREPTKAELDRFLKAKLITRDDYTAELRRMGYAEKWVEMFAKIGVGGLPSGGN